MDGRIALFDMDDTLFDYTGKLAEDLHSVCSEADLAAGIGLTPERHNAPQWLYKRIDIIRRQPGWWRDLPRLHNGWQILEACQEIGFCCRILTKGPRSKSSAWQEKLDCINFHLGENFPVNMVNSGSDEGKDKSDIYGRVLVDDYPPFIENWLVHRTRGLGIVPAQPWNESYSNPNVFRYRGPEDLEELKELLAAVYQRNSKQHWRDVLLSNRLGRRS